jgi:hypothetical protein
MCNPELEKSNKERMLKDSKRNRVMAAEKIQRRRQTKKGKELKYRQRTVNRWRETAEREGWKKREFRRRVLVPFPRACFFAHFCCTCRCWLFFLGLRN